MRTPPSDGPATRLAFTIEELRAMALGTSARPSTIETTKACRAGVSKALIIPWNTCRPMISPTVMMPANVRMASASDWR